MDNEQYTVHVLFRRLTLEDNSQVWAIFPFELADMSGNVTVFDTHTSHGAGNLAHMLEITHPISPEDHEKLPALKRTIREMALGYGYVIKEVDEHTARLSRYFSSNR
jgi:hypothetical protein